MAAVSAFRSDAARAAYLKLYDAALATSNLPVTELDIETSFGTTHVLTAGDPSKPALVALHGMEISSTMWVLLLPILAANHSVTMIDAIDEAGKSIATKPPSNSAELVAWLDETLRAVDILRSAIVGASRGAWIGTNYAIAFPERVERLALVCPVGIVRGLKLSFLMRGLTTMGVRPTEERIWSFLDAMVMPTNRRSLREEPWRPIMQQFVGGSVGFKAAVSRPLMKPWPMRPDCDLRPLAAARIPVLAIMGRDDSCHHGPKAAARFRQQLPEARVELVDDANHMILSDQPEIVEKLLTDFLQ
ncbi:hypothetical protein A5707_15850 [Mycobacterium kyorinense]|uniref:AB hydrolase-1 domain-containing protein n=1 Tax=Mycobacterium kyorinense TaxID=487514 RepID=A0A1A2ZJT6_9MYCO|nr:alpha/beta hydrolase [Mycobacterium kyorinense]OBI49948.1 hypothetical protein A5707_15850 [Mycobacterium kyorinense]